MRDPRITEQPNLASQHIDELDALGIVDLINDQDRMIAAAVGQERESIARALELAEHAFRHGGRLIYVGAGTSGRLGVLDASEMPPTYGTDPSMVRGVIAGGYEALVRAQEGAEDHPEDGAKAIDELGVGERDFVLGIATSGTTPYVHGAVDQARALGASVGFLMCTPPPPELVERLDVVIAPLVGAEVITGSTRMKAGTATKLVLNTITTGAMVFDGCSHGCVEDMRRKGLRLSFNSDAGGGPADIDFFNENLAEDVCDKQPYSARPVLNRVKPNAPMAPVPLCS